MRIMYVLPAPVARTSPGQAEIDRERDVLREWAFRDTVVDIRDVATGPPSIESAYEEYLSIPATAEAMLEAERDGYDAAVLGCFGDPGLDAMRELLTRMLVIGPAESSCYTGLMLGDSLGIVTVTDSIVRPLRELVARLGLSSKLAGIAVVDTPVLELYDRERTVTRAVAAGERLIERDGANVLTLGCMTMAFLEIDRDLEEALGVPVVNPARTALKTTEALVGAGLGHSKRAYPRPPKLAAEGSDVRDLLLA
jgi:allantoin racemase